MELFNTGTKYWDDDCHDKMLWMRMTDRFCVVLWHGRRLPTKPVDVVHFV